MRTPPKNFTRLDENERAKQTINTVRLARQIGRARRPRKKLPRQLPPRPVEREYVRLLLPIVAQVRASLEPLLAALPDILKSAELERRTDAGESRRIKQLIDAASESIQGTVNTTALETLAERVANRAAVFNLFQLRRQIRAALGADVFINDRALPALVDGFVAENVALIKDVPRKIISDIEKSVTRAVTSATPHPELAKQIENQFAFGRDRARLIARDQVGKLYGQINATRQKTIGVDSFIWRTVNDERVRDEHTALEGQQFTYKNPPAEGLPGEPILCRCYAEPVFDFVEEI